MTYKKKCPSLLLAVLLFLSSMSINQSVAATNWQASSYSHFSNNEPLVALLEDLSASIKVPIKLSKKLRAADHPVFNGELNGSSANVLNKIARLYNLVWYFDNHMVYVYNGNENSTQLIQMTNISPAIAKQSLEQSGVYDTRFSWQPMKGAKTVIISGPPRYLELAQQVIQAYDGMAAAKTDKNAHSVR